MVQAGLVVSGEGRTFAPWTLPLGCSQNSPRFQPRETQKQPEAENGSGEGIDRHLAKVHQKLTSWAEAAEGPRSRGQSLPSSRAESPPTVPPVRARPF